MWAEYFPRAEIVGIDITNQYDEGLLTQFHGLPPEPAARIRVLEANATAPEVLELLEGEPAADLVIDDGSHNADDIAATFDLLFLHCLRPGGVYVIEDTLNFNDLSPF